MNRRDFVRRVANLMRENNIRKPVSTPRHVFHISDDEGNTKNFIIKKTDKTVMYTAEDVDAILESCICVIEELLRRGDSLSIQGFGSLGLKYRKARKTKAPSTEEWVEVAARYIPKFSFGERLRLSAKIYELSLQDGKPLPVFDESEEKDDGN